MQLKQRACCTQPAQQTWPAGHAAPLQSGLRAGTTTARGCEQQGCVIALASQAVGESVWHRQKGVFVNQQFCRENSSGRKPAEARGPDVFAEAGTTRRAR